MCPFSKSSFIYSISLTRFGSSGDMNFHQFLKVLSTAIDSAVSKNYTIGLMFGTLPF